MRRRELITLLGGAVAWPLAARAQQRPSLPIVGFLSGRSSGESRYLVAAFHDGLREAGFVEGQNISTEYRWADGQYDRLAGYVADLIRRQVSAIVAVGAVAGIRAAKRATSAIPIIFVTGDDPVRLGLVASLNRPGGNVTGCSLLSQDLEPKRLAILHDVAPRETAIAMLVNPNGSNVERQVTQAQEAARTLGRELKVLPAGVAGDIDRVFATFAQQGAGALMVSGDPFLNSRREQIATLAVSHKIPTLSPAREFALLGGLMSYGPSVEDSYRQAGAYAARVLKGEKPADLPVMRPTKFDLVINLKTANALGLDLPDKLLALADEVIE